MKFVALALLGAASAVRLEESPDCPDSTKVFSYNERVASAAGLVQTACDKAAVAGVPCNSQLFATGMNGDEDLGQNIIMKGDKYHYNQNSLMQTGFATGMNGDEDLGQNIIMKGDKYHYNQAMSQFATGMNGDEDLGQNIIMKGDKYHYNQNMAQFATGMNGDEDLGQNIIMKGDKYHYNQE